METTENIYVYKCFHFISNQCDIFTNCKYPQKKYNNNNKKLLYMTSMRKF